MPEGSNALLDALIEAGPAWPDDLKARAERLGVDQTTPWRLAVLESVDERPLPADLLAAAARTSVDGERSLSCSRGWQLVIAVLEGSEDGIRTKLRHLTRLARGRGGEVRAGVSSPGVDFGRALAQAEAALDLARRTTERVEVFHGESKPASAVVSRRARRMLEGPGARGDDRETQLLTIGERLVAAGSFHETPISTIAGEAGLSRSGFYFYFASKDELLAELVARTLDQNLRGWTPMVEKAGADPEQSVYSIVENSARMWEDHPQVLRAAVELFSRVPAIREQWLQAVADARELLAELIIKLTRDPELREPARAREMAETLIWLFERNFYVASFKGPGNEAVQAKVKTVAEAWVGAMGVREPR